MRRIAVSLHPDLREGLPDPADGDAQRERLVHDEALGVAAVGDAAQVLVRRVVGEGRRPFAELLLASAWIMGRNIFRPSAGSMGR